MRANKERDWIEDFSLAEGDTILILGGSGAGLISGNYTGTAGEIRSFVRNDMTVVRVDFDGDADDVLEIFMRGQHDLTSDDVFFGSL